MSYGAAGAVNNSRAKGAVVANQTKQGSNARPRDVYVSLLFSTLNSVWHSRPRSRKGTKNVFKPSENACGSALLQIQERASERAAPLRFSFPCRANASFFIKDEGNGNGRILFFTPTEKLYTADCTGKRFYCFLSILWITNNRPAQLRFFLCYFFLCSLKTARTSPSVRKGEKKLHLQLLTRHRLAIYGPIFLLVPPLHPQLL